MVTWNNVICQAREVRSSPVVWHLDSRLLSSLLGMTFSRWAMPFSVNSTEPLPPEMPNPEVLLCCKCTWWWEPEIKTGHVNRDHKVVVLRNPPGGQDASRKYCFLVLCHLLPHLEATLEDLTNTSWVGQLDWPSPHASPQFLPPVLMPPQTSSSVVPHLKLTHHNPWLSFFKFTGQQPGGPWCSGSLCWLWVSGTPTSEIKPT